jgi:HNH endonuclease
MKRAAGTCNQPGCANVPVYRGRCILHVEWSGLTPRQRGRALVERRHRIMRARGRVCEQCGEPPPLELHHRDGDTSNDRPANLQLLCLSCHREATAWQRSA